MGEVKQINIKNQTYYFFNDIINLKDFESNLLKIGIDIYYIGYITVLKNGDFESIYSVNLLYLRVHQ